MTAADLTVTAQLTNLPPLDEPCPHCTGPDADAERKANADAWRRWDADEEAAYNAFTSTYQRETGDAIGVYAAWAHSAQCRDLWDRQPEALPEQGCVECDYVGRRPTVAGRQVLDFLNTYQRKG